MVFISKRNRFNASLHPAVPLKSLCIVGRSNDLSHMGREIVKENKARHIFSFSFVTSSSLLHLLNFNMEQEAIQIAEDCPKEKVR